ncbi:unnamed protein product [Haemonchus placei]|uniref:Uncharacterized protein n=1 Tax=Haemonchus placei TaxID=6290 RepID=A0A3P7Y3P1_HAEPC|nr:unnamed protein product [Haemonchus placei]
MEQFTALAEDLILDAQATYANAFNTTQFLKHFHEHGGTTVGGATLDAWARESEAHYNATLERGKYIEKRLNRAEQEHKYCKQVYRIWQKNEELLKKVFANKLNDTSFENLQERLDEFDQWLEDYRYQFLKPAVTLGATIYDSARRDTAEAERMSNVVAKRIDRYKEVSNEIEKLRAEARATIYDSARRDTAEAERMSNVVAKRIDRYKEVSNEIEKLRAEAEDDLAAARNAVDNAKGKELLNMFDDNRAMNETLKTAADASSECRNISMM